MTEFIKTHVPCGKCGQKDIGQTGEYPCSECGLPYVHDIQETGKVDRCVKCGGALIPPSPLFTGTCDCQAEVSP